MLGAKGCRFVGAALLVAVACSGLPGAFDWPQDETNADSFSSYFAQLRGDKIESSIVFRESSSDVRAAGDYGWFDSPLGNAVVIAHGDSISTVYGNLDEESLPESLSGSVASGMKIGESGSSAWHEGEGGLEFQVLDLANKSCVNPRLLMPRIGEELKLLIGNLSLDDNLIESRGTLCVQGNDKYSVADLYPDTKRRLLSVIYLAHGHSTLSVTVSDLLGESHQIKYNIDID